MNMLGEVPESWWKCGWSSIWGKCLIMMNMLPGEVPDGSVDGAVSEGSMELEERFGEDSEGEDAKSR